MVVTTDLLTKSTMDVARKKDATVSEENTMTTHTALQDIKIGFQGAIQSRSHHEWVGWNRVGRFYENFLK